MKKTKNDVILIAVVLILAAAFFAVYSFTAKKGKIVEVSIDGQTVSAYSLSKDFKTDIKTQNGKTNTLVIENGEAYVSYADCPDKVCVSHRKISRSGESVICLPHKLVISIKED